MDLEIIGVQRSDCRVEQSRAYGGPARRDRGARVGEGAAGLQHGCSQACSFSLAAHSFCPSHCALSTVAAQSCKAEIARLATQRGYGFWVSFNGALKHLTRQMYKLATCIPGTQRGRLGLVDVGAGLYAPPNLHGFEVIDGAIAVDDSDALYLLAGFGGRANVHAFEMNPAKAKELKRAVRLRPATQAYRHRLHVHTMGVGNTTKAARIAQCGPANTWRVWDTTRAKYLGCKRGEQINETTLDAFALRERSLRGGIFYVKVDVEGGEWAVLEGMQSLLRNQRVQLMSFEYGNGWHEAYGPKEPVPLALRPNIEHTLFNFQRRLLALGYDTYLLHGWRPPPRHSRGANARDITLVPVYGDFWDDRFEICFDRKLFYRQYNAWCWNDLLIIRRGNTCLKHELLKIIHGHSLFPSCECL